MIWSVLYHLGYNMWAEKGASHSGMEFAVGSDTLRCQKNVWDEMCAYAAQNGVNTVVIDLGEGVRYDSHPELAIPGTWSKQQLRESLAQMREMGLTPIPKLNFSTAHDEWLGEYSHMISTDTYHKVCRELIEEVCDLFDKPAYFHLGMDEETAGHQAEYFYSVVRAPELWWHDLYMRFEDVERCGVTPWVWSDFIWHHEESFLKKMPKHVLQSNWYYGRIHDHLNADDRLYLNAFRTLSEHGYKQVPTGSNWSTADNFEPLAAWCAENIAPESLAGFMNTAWMPTVAKRKHRHYDAVDQLAEARKQLEK